MQLNLFGTNRWSVGAVAFVLLLMEAAVAHGQALRGPDLGVWFTPERVAGANALFVAELIEDGPFGLAGLSEGDRIVSINGKAIDSEANFVHEIMALAFADRPINLVIARQGQQQTLVLKPAAARQVVVNADPLYQAGLIIDDRYAEFILVQRVFPLTPAFYAGLRQGDVITSVGRKPVSSLAELTDALRKGGKLNLGVSRADHLRQMTISVGTERRRPLGGYTTLNGLAPGAASLAPAFVPSRAGIGSPPLLIPPSTPANPPVVPTAPPPIAQQPPPGTVLNR
jgi:S1-C subfamily serine protease